MPRRDRKSLEAARPPAATAAAARTATVATTIAGDDVLGELGPDLRGQRRELTRRARAPRRSASPRAARARGPRARRAARPRGRRPKHRPAQDAVDHAGPEARLAVSVAELRQERDPAAVDARAEQLEERRQDGDRAGDRAGDHDDRAGRDPVEDVRADHELPGHRDRDGRPGDQHRAAGGAGRCARAPRATTRRGAAPRASG